MRQTETLSESLRHVIALRLRSLGYQGDRQIKLRQEPSHVRGQNTATGSVVWWAARACALERFSQGRRSLAACEVSPAYKGDDSRPRQRSYGDDSGWLHSLGTDRLDIGGGLKEATARLAMRGAHVALRSSSYRRITTGGFKKGLTPLCHCIRN